MTTSTHFLSRPLRPSLVLSKQNPGMLYALSDHHDPQHPLIPTTQTL
jgi:hypothetical protein